MKRILIAIAACLLIGSPSYAQGYLGSGSILQCRGPAGEGQTFQAPLPEGVKDYNGKIQGRSGSVAGVSNSMPGGGTPFFNDAVAGTVVQVKATRGLLHFAILTNTVAAVTYLQIFCKPSASVTLGTTVADFVIRMAASAAMQVPLGICHAGTGISLAGTTSPTNSTGAAVSVGAIYN